MELFREIEEKSTAITANQRLAHHLTYRYHAWQRKRGKRTWESPDILPWNAWIERLYEETSMDAPHRVLLSPFQERILWQRIIQASPQGETLLHVASTAKKAQEAWLLLHAWRIPLEALDAHFGEDVQAFLGWARTFKARCDDEGWLDAARLPEALASLPQGRHRRLALGFLETTPQQQALFERLGVKVMPLPSHSPSPVRVAMADRLREIEAAAQWARALVEAAEEPPSIAILMPDLPSLREEAIQCLDEILCPPALLPWQTHSRPYNLSLGRPLDREPIVKSALLSLRLLKGLSLEEASLWLRSPFLGEGEEERIERALLEAHLREKRALSLSLHDLLEASSEKCPSLSRRLGELSSPPPFQTPRAWAKTFEGLLRTLGWPGERTLESHEYQGMQAWQGLLETFAGLGSVWPSMDLPNALTQIEHQARETLFQPRTPEVPIQVLGMLEAIGMTFDHLWVMGLDDGRWPPAPQPNPFLPLPLQRRHNLPGSSAERELKYARRITEQLQKSAPCSIFSYPLREKDQSKRPSPLIVPFPPGEPPISPFSSYVSLIFQSRRLDTFEDAQAPPLPPGIRVEGGKDVLRFQAACPFRAFARFRLGATSLAKVEGFNAADRGILLHRVMERLWRTLKDHARLCRLPDASLRELVQRIVNQVVKDAALRHPQIFTPRLQAMEKARLGDLVMKWLAIEKARPPFRVSAETERTVKLGGIEIGIRVDRVDTLEGGGKVIMDYKTGKANIRDWEGERPDDPQLPLYAQGVEGTVALCFASIHRDEMKMEGLSMQGDVAPSLNAIGEQDFGERMALWGKVLEGLGQDFQKGLAQVDPKDPQKTCRYCDLSALCRIKEQK